jgi:tRNA A37 threonylcarbamoyladenosine dehydratase/nitroreductase
MSSTARDLEAKLGALAARGAAIEAWAPQRFQLDVAADRGALTAILESGQVFSVHDTLDMQLLELATTRAPWLKANPVELAERARLLLGGQRLDVYGTWVFFPWSGKLVHVLPEAEYRELRSARNHYKITKEEQAVLGTKRIGIIGLSVGQASAVTMAQEGVGRTFRLADFDALSLSNMNRLRAPVASLGVPKVIIAAREMAEIDPYLTIEIHPEGVTEANATAFLLGDGTPAGRLDLLVEECDSLHVKLQVRELAAEHRIPVLMETNNCGMLDVERFDLESGRPPLHGLLRDVRASDVKSLSSRDKVPYVLGILGEDSFTPRMSSSMFEVDETLSSWPQLGSGVALGAALVTDTARRILLGTLTASGRYFVDLEQLIRDDTTAPLRPLESFDAGVSALALQAPALVLPAAAQRELTREDVRRLVAYGVEAPSGGNVQPWRFAAKGSTLRCSVDLEQPTTILDFEAAGTHLAIGAAVENMDLAARAAGLSCGVRAFPDSRDRNVVAELAFGLGRGPSEPPPLFGHISARATNRRLARWQPIAVEQLQSLQSAAESAGGRLQVITDPQRLEAIGRILGGGDRVRFLSRQLHDEMMSEVRWTPAEVESTRTGVDVATLELSRTDLAGIRLARNYGNLRFLMEIGGGRALEKSAKDAIASSSGVGLVTMKGPRAERFFQGGRAVQRVWLTATALGLGFQPWTSITFLWARMERGEGVGLEAKQIPALRQLREQYLEIFRLSPDESEIMLFRLSHAGPPTARALRRPVEEVLTFEDA